MIIMSLDELTAERRRYFGLSNKTMMAICDQKIAALKTKESKPLKKSLVRE